jgi:hypothetical protein
MSQNPYEAPRVTDAAIGVKSGRREDLLPVAQYQKGIIYCILANIVLFILNLAAGQSQSTVAGLVIVGLYAIVAVAQLVLIALLAAKVYNVVLGIFIGIFSFVPCLGLLLLLVVNQKATSVLQQNGIRVGLMGADMSQLR